MVLVATYSGSLVAFLTFPRMDESISSVEILVKRKDQLTWSLPANSFLVESLMGDSQSSEIDPYVSLLGDNAHFAERHDRNNYEAVVQRVKEGKHVLVDWITSLRMLTKIDNPLIRQGSDKATCHFSIGAETFVEEKIALFVPSNSPYLTLINTE